MRTEQELKELLQKYSEGRCSPAEERLLQEWFARIGEGQTSAGLSGDDRRRMLANFTNSPRLSGQGKPPKLRFLKAWRMGAVAAGVAGILFFSWLLLQHNQKNAPVFGSKAEIAFLEVATGSGEVKQVVLPDSSVVWLNARSQLAYHPDFATHREIRLSGEALFEVTRDKQHPFTVLTADSLQTTVLGTQFNIRSYRSLNETQVTVVSGQVQVALAHKNEVMGRLIRNQALRFDRAKQSYVQVEVNAAALSDWRNGIWALKGQGVEELAVLLYNQYGITVINRGQGLNTLYVDANFTKQQDAKEIVSTFCLLAGCRYTWRDNATVELY